MLANLPARKLGWKSPGRAIRLLCPGTGTTYSGALKQKAVHETRFGVSSAVLTTELALQKGQMIPSASIRVSVSVGLVGASRWSDFLRHVRSVSFRNLKLAFFISPCGVCRQAAFCRLSASFAFPQRYRPVQSWQRLSLRKPPSNTCNLGPVRSLRPSKAFPISVAQRLNGSTCLRLQTLPGCFPRENAQANEQPL